MNLDNSVSTNFRSAYLLDVEGSQLLLKLETMLGRLLFTNYNVGGMLVVQQPYITFCHSKCSFLVTFANCDAHGAHSNVLYLE